MKEESTPSEPGALADFLDFRSALTTDRSGGVQGSRLSDLADAALRQLSEAYDDVAVIAVGGYGRQEMCLYSDVDLLLLHEGRAPEEAVRSILYPLWDAGLKVGHATRTVKATLAFAREDHNTLCALLSARHLSGPPEPLDELEQGIARLLSSMRGAFAERLAAEQRSVWEQEPFALQEFDVKNGRGGLRSLHRLFWDRKRAQLLEEEPLLPVQANESGARRVLLEVRQALHAVQRRGADRFPIELRAAVGAWLGRDPLELATELYQAVRTVDGLAALRWGQVRPAGTDPIAHAGLAVVRLVRSRWSRREAMTTPLAFGTGAVASHTGGRLSVWEHGFARRSGAPDWQEGDRSGLVSLLASGRAGWEAVLGLWEAGWMTRALPEIAHLRGLAQAAPFHAHPADAHLGATVAIVVELAEGPPGWLSEIVEQVGSLDEVLLAAFLHDIGKGQPGDHSETGSNLAKSMLARLGFRTATVDLVADAVHHHLLLSETAARRDIDDPVVVKETASLIGNVDLLRVLALLSVADARATGPDLWTPWKESLLRSLVAKVESLVSGASSSLEGQLLEDLKSPLPELESSPIHHHLERMPAGYLARFGADLVSHHVRLLTPPPVAGEVRTVVLSGAPVSTLVVATVDRPALLATVAGVLSLRNLNVREARAVTSADRLVVDTFRVEDALGSDMVGQGRWPAVREELAAAIGGRIDLTERLLVKRQAYPPRTVANAPEVRVNGKYVDVRAGDRVGLLYDLASAMSELGLEVKLAKIDTRAGEAIDVFEVDNPLGHSPATIEARLVAAAS
ncbi:MAG: HD domain-containing protein [Actinomycetota bacterium]|nr:HD domain-containing protein [Actinomycetota bacterium]